MAGRAWLAWGDISGMVFPALYTDVQAWVSFVKIRTNYRGVQYSMPRIKVFLFIFALITVTALAACSGTPTPTPTPLPQGITIVEPPGDPFVFTLTDHNGEEITGEDLHGKYTLFFFGFTNCPDFCPGTLVNYKQVKNILGESAAGINFMMISVDHQRDTPEQMAEYLGFFDETFLGATGPTEELDQTVGQYGAQYYIGEPDESGAYMVEHTTSSFLLAPDGRWVRLYSYDTPAAVVAADIEQLMAAAGGAAAGGDA